MKLQPILTDKHYRKYIVLYGVWTNQRCPKVFGLCSILVIYQELIFLFVSALFISVSIWYGRSGAV